MTKKIKPFRGDAKHLPFSTTVWGGPILKQQIGQHLLLGSEHSAWGERMDLIWSRTISGVVKEQLGFFVVFGVVHLLLFRVLVSLLKP
jgi:hypothetical protein